MSRMLMYDTLGLSGYHIQQLKDTAASGFNGYQIGNFSGVSSATFGACGGLSAGHLTRYFSCDILFWVPRILHLELTTHLCLRKGANQIAQLSGEATSGFTANQTSVITNAALSALSLAQLGSFSADGISGFAPAQLALLTNQWLQGFTSLWNLQQVSTCTVSTILSLKNLAFTRQVVQPQSFPSLAQLPTTTWLQFALLNGSATNIQFGVAAIQAIYNQSISGIRTDTVAFLDAASIAAISPGQSSNLLSDTIAGFSGSQLAALPPASFGNLPASTFLSIPTSCHPWHHCGPDPIHPSLRALRYELRSDIQLHSGTSQRIQPGPGTHIPQQVGKMPKPPLYNRDTLHHCHSNHWYSDHWHSNHWHSDHWISDH